MNRNAKWFFAIFLAMLMGAPSTGFAQQQGPLQPQQQQVQHGPGVKAMVENFVIQPPRPGQQAKFTVGQIKVAAEEISRTAFYGHFIDAFAAATDRAGQEQAVASYTSPDLLAKFVAMNQGTGGSLGNPEDYQPMTDPVAALNVATVKQPFKTFSDWGVSPFGAPATSWQDLCSTYEDTMNVMVQRTNFPPETKAEWIDELGNACTNGIDGRFKKVVDLTNWPLWQWTTGRIARTADHAVPGRVPGVNVMYTGGSAFALYLFLPKAQMVVLHPFNCRGNPTVPFIQATFQVTKETTKLPSCVKLYRTDGVANVFKTGEMVRYSVQFDNPSNVEFPFRYVLRNLSAGTERILLENAPQVSWQQQQPGNYQLAVVGEYEGKPLDASACVVNLTFNAPPPPPPVIVTPPARPATSALPQQPHKGHGKLIGVLVALAAAGAAAAFLASRSHGGPEKTPPHGCTVDPTTGQCVP